MMRPPRILLILAGLLALACGDLRAGPAHAGQPVTLRDGPATENGRVTLGDLFDGAGDQADVLVAGGTAGVGMVLDAGRVQVFARAHGLDWDNSNGIRRLIVRAGAARSQSSGASSGGLVVTAPSTHAIQVLAYARDINAGDIVQSDDVFWSRTAAPLPDAPRDA